MSRTRLFLLLFTVLIVVLILWGWRRSTQPPVVPFAKVVRQRLVSTLNTNGKVEPYQWTPVRAEIAGLVESVVVQRGQRVERGGLIAMLDSRDARADVASAEAAVAQVRAQLETVAQGGAASARVDIENELARARLDLKTAQADLVALRRLEQKQAATHQQVAQAEQRMIALEAEIQGLERKRAALVDKPDRAAAEAKLRQTEATLVQARTRLDRTRITSPMAGMVYGLPVRKGAYVNAGDLIAAVGNLDRLRVRVYIDEPELGRVAQGMPVKITWDALPGHDWKGAVESTPTEVMALGTRQVGEVVCTIENPGHELLPGTNINAEIQTQVVENALTIPKEAVRRGPDNQVGVFVLRDGRIEWRPVRLGPTSITRSVVLEGVVEGDLVAVSTDQPLTNGARVQPVVR